MTIKKFFFFCFLSFFLFASFHVTKPKILAEEILFQDDFENENADDWEEYDGWGEWQVKQLEDSNFVYEGTVILHGQPENPAYSTNGNINWADYVLEVDLRGTEGVNKTILFRYRSELERYALGIVSEWGIGDPTNCNLIDLHKYSPNDPDRHLLQVSFINYPNTWYRLKIVVVNTNQDTTNIKVYIKDIDHNYDYGLVLEYTDNYYPITSGKVGVLIWPGGYAGYRSITTTQYDNIVVTSLVSTPSPTPTPTPSPNLIILLPGLGASWNHGAMILGDTKPPKDWYMTPFVKSYDGLVQTLKNAGYENSGENQNLFIFNYDWRQQIETTANRLGNYIENTVDPPTGTKIDLIGHSLGGMVARTYIQKNSDHQIDQLVTLGSPHKGAPQVYYLWEGVGLKKALAPWQRIGVGILLHLNKKGYQNNIETIREIIPGLKDLLPTFIYLKQEGVEKPLSEMNQRNNWLESLNQLPLPGFLTSVLNTVLGAKENSTLRWINIIDRNRFDRFLGKWEDGKPVGEEFNDGDETVLVESAQLEGVNVVELSGLDHGDLVETTTGQQAIVDLLELSPSEIVQVVEINYEPSLVFQLASPATITVFGPGSWQIGEGVTNNVPDAIYSSEDKLIVIPSPKEGDYQVHVNKEGDGGDFRLLIGKLLPEGDIWEKFGGKIGDEPKIFTTNFSEDSSKNKLALLSLAKQRLELMREKVLKSRKPFKSFLASTIGWRIRQINRAIMLLKRGKENRAQGKIKETIFSLIFLEKNLKFWSRFCRFSPEFQEELLENIRLAKDYLLQAYEFE